MPSASKLPFLALAAAGCFWGTGFVFGKIALQEVSVPHMILYRFWFACAGLVLVLMRSHTAPMVRDLPAIVLAGVIGVPIVFLIQFEGLARTSVAHASLMVGTFPMLLALAALLFLRERLDGPGWLAILGSTAGAALIVAGSRHAISRTSVPTARGDLLVLLSLLGAVAWVLISKGLLRRYSPVVATAYVYLAGTVVLTAWVWLKNGAPPWRLSAATWLAMAAQGLVATVLSSLLWNWGLTKVPAARAGIFVNFEPLLGSILGMILFGDRLGLPGFAGGALILASAVLLSAHGPAESPAPL
jgi:drug/metabolite transporter (DMT)-like permease